jgi:hypothetical protein
MVRTEIKEATMCLNTEFTYYYRDGQGFQRVGSVVFAGEYDGRQIRRLKKSLGRELPRDEAVYFKPDMVAIPPVLDTDGAVVPAVSPWYAVRGVASTGRDPTDQRDFGHFVWNMECAAALGWTLDPAPPAEPRSTDKTHPNTEFEWIHRETDDRGKVGRGETRAIVLAGNATAAQARRLEAAFDWQNFCGVRPTATPPTDPARSVEDFVRTVERAAVLSVRPVQDVTAADRTCPDMDRRDTACATL